MGSLCFKTSIHEASPLDSSLTKRSPYYYCTDIFKWLDYKKFTPIEQKMWSVLCMGFSVNTEYFINHIKQSLLKQFHQNSTHTSLLKNIESSALSPKELNNILETQIEKDLCLLWAALHKRKDILNELLENGADIQFHDINRLSALHISSFVGCYNCTEFLINKGARINGDNIHTTPLHYAIFSNMADIVELLLNNEAVTFINNYKESILHFAVRANSVDSLNVLIDHKLNGNKLNAYNPIHLAAEMGRAQCLEVLLNSKIADINAMYKCSTALHLASKDTKLECLKLLLDEGADPNLKDHEGSTALHSVISYHYGKLPNDAEIDQTATHSILLSFKRMDSIADTVDLLVKMGAKLEEKDKDGLTPLHLAAQKGMTLCVEVLIKHGADVTTKSNNGISALSVISKNTPSSISVIKEKLNESITLNFLSKNIYAVRLYFDYSNMLKSNQLLEMSYLDTIVFENQKNILLHPLCMTFLHIKWEMIKKFFFARLLFYVTLIFLLTLYVFIIPRTNCKIDPNICEMIQVLKYILVVIISFEILCKLIGIYSYKNLYQFITHKENIFKWIFIICVIVIIFDLSQLKCVGAFAVLVGWTNLMLMIGQLPIFGLYISMYQKVLKEFLKLFATYFCILIGFTASFCTLFPNSDEFKDAFVGFINILTMMVGELDTKFLYFDKKENVTISVQITYIFFLMTVTIVLMNLLVGIAVNDIKELKKTAKTSKLVRQTELISCIESTLLNAYLPKFLVKYLRKSVLISSQEFTHIYVNPLDPMEKRLPSNVIMEAYNIAKDRMV